MSEDKGNVHHCVLDTDALVGTTPEDEVVSGVRMSSAVRIQPAGRVEFLGVAVDLGILERVVEGGDDHAVGGNGVIIGDRKSASSFVWNL